MTDWIPGWEASDGLLIARPRGYDRTMSDHPTPAVTPEVLQAFVQRSLDWQAEIREELGSMRDDAAVLLAIVMRIDGTVSGLVKEVRAMHSQHSRLATRVTALEKAH
jgi:hypothetical protein